MNGQSQPSIGRPIPILYEDAHYIVFDKPSGLLVIPTHNNEKHTLTSIVNAHYLLRHHEGGNKDSIAKLHPCHRLDQETSGAIIYAKGKTAREAMMAIFKNRSIKKTYIGFVHGRLRQSRGTLVGKIQDWAAQQYDRFGEGKTAVTHYHVTSFQKHFSVLEIKPITGRTNQIRIQFAQIGHPLVGERKYCIAKDFQIKFKRVALHAHALEWKHSFTHQKITVTSNLPKDMEEFLERHRN